MSELNLSILIEALDRFSAPARKIAGASGKLTDKLKDGQAALGKLGAQTKAIERMKALSTGLGKTAAEMDKATRRTATLGRALAKSTKPTKKLQQQFDAARRASDALKKRHAQQRTELGALRGELRGAGIDTRKLGAEQRRLSDDMAAVNVKMAKMTRVSEKLTAARANYDRHLQNAANISLVAGGVERAGRTAMGMVGQPIAQMRMVERSKGELASLGIDKTGVEQIAARGRALSGELAGITTSGFTSAAYDIKSGIASLSDQGVADMTALAAITAKATKADVGQMTGLFATGYGSFKDALHADIGDAAFGEILSASLAKSVQMFKTDGSKMQQAIQSMGSGLAVSGVSIADQLTGLGMLQQKMEAGMAGTTLAAVERTAGQARERFQEMGLEIDTLDDAGNLRSLPDLLDKMQAAFGNTYTTETGAMIQQAFGSDEAVKFFKSLWGQQDTFRANAAALKEAQGAGEAFTRTMANAMDNNMDARMQILQQRWDVVRERLGTALIPALERAIPWIEKLAAAVTGFIENNSGAAGTVAALVGGFGVLATAVAPVITAVASLAAGLAFLRFGLAKTLSKVLASDFDDASHGKKRGKGGKGRRWRGLARGIGGVGGKLGLLGAGIGAVSIGSTLTDDSLSASEKASSISQDVGGIGGAIAGAAAGAALGSVVPVVGTAIGGIVGGIAGGFGGDKLGAVLGEKLAGLFGPRDPAPSAALATRIDDAANPVRQATGTIAAMTEENAPGPIPGAVTSRPELARIEDRSTHTYNISVTQQSGEDTETLTERVLSGLKEMADQRQRQELYDGV